MDSSPLKYLGINSGGFREAHSFFIKGPNRFLDKSFQNDVCKITKDLAPQMAEILDFHVWPQFSETPDPPLINVWFFPYNW
jgi:hypothetical protein